MSQNALTDAQHSWATAFIGIDTRAADHGGPEGGSEEGSGGPPATDAPGGGAGGPEQMPLPTGETQPDQMNDEEIVSKIVNHYGGILDGWAGGVQIFGEVMKS